MCAGTSIGVGQGHNEQTQAFGKVANGRPTAPTQILSMFENVEEVHHASDGFYLHPMYASDQK